MRSEFVALDAEMFEAGQRSQNAYWLINGDQLVIVQVQASQLGQVNQTALLDTVYSVTAQVKVVQLV